MHEAWRPFMDQGTPITTSKLRKRTYRLVFLCASHLLLDGGDPLGARHGECAFMNVRPVLDSSALLYWLPTLQKALERRLTHHGIDFNGMCGI